MTTARIRSTTRSSSRSMAPSRRNTRVSRVAPSRNGGAVDAPGGVWQDRRARWAMAKVKRAVRRGAAPDATQSIAIEGGQSVTIGGDQQLRVGGRRTVAVGTDRQATVGGSDRLEVNL